jgi:hypothetical protein
MIFVKQLDFQDFSEGSDMDPDALGHAARIKNKSISRTSVTILLPLLRSRIWLKILKRTHIIIFNAQKLKLLLFFENNQLTFETHTICMTVRTGYRQHFKKLR